MSFSLRLRSPFDLNSYLLLAMGSYDKSIVKGKSESRAVPVNNDGRLAIRDLIEWHRDRYGDIDGSRPLFPSRHKSGRVAMHRQTAHDILKTGFVSVGLNGKLATHSLRKSFAQRVYEQSNDIYLVQELLGHKSVSTTQRYLGVNYAAARAVVEKMAVDVLESYRTANSSDSLKTIDDETLQSELEKRGYNVTSQQENETTAEIVKIG